jgi:hypothetical protein
MSHRREQKAALRHINLFLQDFPASMEIAPPRHHFCSFSGGWLPRPVEHPFFQDRPFEICHDLLLPLIDSGP